MIAVLAVDDEIGDSARNRMHWDRAMLENPPKPSWSTRRRSSRIPCDMRSNPRLARRDCRKAVSVNRSKWDRRKCGQKQPLGIKSVREENVNHYKNMQRSNSYFLAYLI